MGMFDTVRVDMPIPGHPELAGEEFQTKDFDCLLDTYRVAADGTFQRPEKRREEGFYFYTMRGRDWFEFFARIECGKVVEIRVVESPKKAPEETGESL